MSAHGLLYLLIAAQWQPVNTRQFVLALTIAGLSLLIAVIDQED